MLNKKNDWENLDVKEESLSQVKINFEHRSRICETTNVWEADLNVITKLEEYDMQDYNFQDTDNENGPPSE